MTSSGTANFATYIASVKYRSMGLLSDTTVGRGADFVRTRRTDVFLMVIAYDVYTYICTRVMKELNFLFSPVQDVLLTTPRTGVADEMKNFSNETEFLRQQEQI